MKTFLRKKLKLKTFQTKYQELELITWIPNLKMSSYKRSLMILSVN